jgi:cytochrome P450
VTEFARPYAVEVTCHVLGVDPAHRSSLQHDAGQLLAFLGTPDPEPQLGAVATQALDRVTAYVRGRLAGPEGDLLRTAAADGMTELESVAAFAQLLTGGVDPLAHSVSAALHLLLTEARPTPGAAGPGEQWTDTDRRRRPGPPAPGGRQPRPGAVP